MVLQHSCMTWVIANSLIASYSIDFLNFSYNEPPSLLSRPFIGSFLLGDLFITGSSVIRTHLAFRHIINTLSDHNMEKAFLLMCFLVFSIQYSVSQLFLHGSFPYFNGLIYYKSRYIMCHIDGCLSCIASFC